MPTTVDPLGKAASLWCSCLRSRGAILAVALLMAGCAINPQVIRPLPTPGVAQDLAIFFDGTANNEASNTNIKKLHSLVALQGRAGLGTFYVDGVGAKGKVLGMATGWGIGRRVRMAYRYLLENYPRADRILRRVTVEGFAA